MSRLKKLIHLAAMPAAWRPMILTRTAVAVEHLDMLRHVKPSTVIDVGANKGQFALAALAAGAKRVLSFEPLSTEATVYRRNLSTFPAVQLFEVALSNTDGEAVFHIADRADSSSLLVVGSGQKQAFSVSERDTITVPVKRLEQMVNPDDLSGSVLLKIDVQGAENVVLEGAAGLLPHVDFVYAEASFVELYEKQVLADELVKLMNKHGFILRGIYNRSYTSAFGSTQADLLFISNG